MKPDHQPSRMFAYFEYFAVKTPVFLQNPNEITKFKQIKRIKPLFFIYGEPLSNHQYGTRHPLFLLLKMRKGRLNALNL